MSSKKVPEDLHTIAELMDSRFSIFGFRFGADGLMGLIPGLGDIPTNMVSLYIIVRGAMIGIPPAILMRMGGNVLFENIVGFIPVFGSLFDFVWRANLKNVALMEAYFENPVASSRKNRTLLILLCLALFFLLLLIPILVVAFLVFLHGLVF